MLAWLFCLRAPSPASFKEPASQSPVAKERNSNATRRSDFSNPSSGNIAACCHCHCRAATPLYRMHSFLQHGSALFGYCLLALCLTSKKHCQKHIPSLLHHATKSFDSGGDDQDRFATRSPFRDRRRLGSRKKQGHPCFSAPFSAFLPVYVIDGTNKRRRKKEERLGRAWVSHVWPTFPHTHTHPSIVLSVPAFYSSLFIVVA